MDYTPELVDRWLREWELLRSLAETPASSAHLLSPQCRHSDRACANGKPVGIKDVRNHGDPVRYADIKADLEQAADQLPPYSLESLVVARRMSTGARLAEVARLCGTRYDDALHAYRGACKLMAKALGWVDVDREPESC